MRTLCWRACWEVSVFFVYFIERANSQEHYPLLEGMMTPTEACADFAAGGYPEAAWTLEDCVKVWESYAFVIPTTRQRRYAHVDLWKDTAAELRRVGSPCLVQSRHASDGAGSSTIRHLASWIFSEQMGCDWVTPEWGGRPLRGGNGTTLYCHKSATNEELQQKLTAEEKRATFRCSAVNWLQYFQFNVPSVSLPQDEELRYIELIPRATSVRDLRADLWKKGHFEEPGYRVVFTYQASHASNQLRNLGSWDESKREVVRRVLREARDNFHRHPRPWYDESPTCAFTGDRLHFAIHVRMGDRREYQDASVEYFEMLERIVEIISGEVVDRGLVEPLFHVFTETSTPCPSRETRVFSEFPAWPVDHDEVVQCGKAPPDDCNPRKPRSACTTTRDGIFKVLGKNILLHVDPDVQNALSCMIQADGVLMGCSTFGQVAGILSRGISMFSMQCHGGRSPDQYLTTPPLAVAERGRMWVPIEGSWRDPVLSSLSSFRRALDTLLSYGEDVRQSSRRLV